VISHTYFLISLYDALQQINAFLTINPNEIIIITYKNDTEHTSTINSDGLSGFIKECLPNLTTTLNTNNALQTLSNIFTGTFRVLLLNNSEDITDDWYNSQNINDFMNSYYNFYQSTSAPTNILNILEAVLTPDSNSILTNIGIGIGFGIGIYIPVIIILILFYKFCKYIFYYRRETVVIPYRDTFLQNQVPDTELSYKIFKIFLYFIFFIGIFLAFIYTGLLISSNIYGLYSNSQQIKGKFLNNIVNNNGKYNIFMLDFIDSDLTTAIINKNFLS